jgi:hypothetical protein
MINLAPRADGVNVGKLESQQFQIQKSGIAESVYELQKEPSP